MNEVEKTILSTCVERILFEALIPGFVATIYENERPLRGFSGLMDWYFYGVFSQYIKMGAISGKEGECIYFPIKRNDVLYHAILVGSGYSKNPGERHEPSKGTLKMLQKNLASLRVPKFCISKSDFGFVDNEFFSTYLKGVSLCIIE